MLELDLVKIMLDIMRDEEISQKQLAYMLGYSQSYISEVLSGKRPVTYKLADALGYQEYRIYVKR